MNRRSKLLCITFSLLVAFFVLVPGISMDVEAKARKVTSNYNYRKAPTVKTGTTKITARLFKPSGKSMAGFVKFKAPKAGKYSFEFSNVTVKGKGSDVIGTSSVTFHTGTGGAGSVYPKKYLNVKTKGGKNTVLWLCTKETYSILGAGKTTKHSFLPSRAGTVKLKKGQIVYMQFINTDVMNYTLKIKRK